MKKLSYLLILLVFACKTDKKEHKEEEISNSEPRTFESVDVEVLLKDDSLSVRAIEIIGENLAFAGNKGMYGLYNSASKSWKTNVQKYDTIIPEFRAVGSTANDFFMLSVANPALLYKTGDTGQMELVYKEEDEKVFYDSMAFWNDLEGLAMGDPTDGCISIIITRDGGKSWSKITCEDLPAAAEGEAAFAASNSNIAIQDENTWILTGGMKSRILFSPDKGKSWEIFDTPLLQGEATKGGYSLDFYDSNTGVIIGGDYTNPEGNSGNKAISRDGGRTWDLIGEGKDPGYRSSIRFVPASNGKGLVAVGFEGISYSPDQGKTWKELSNEGFYTIRFLNDSLAYAAGKGRIAKITFR